jgi:DNA-binding helix-hairpin-helix protein with protein kinase domain
MEVIWDFFIATLLKIKTHFTNHKRTPQVQKTVAPVQQQFQTQTKKKQSVPYQSKYLPSVQSSKQSKATIHNSKNLLLPKPKELIITNNGKKVYTEAGYTYTLQKQIGFGGEGAVHIISKQLLAKIFHPDKATNEKLKKLQKFLSMKKIASVVFPEKILYDKNKNFIGYTMPQVFGVKELGILHSKKNREKYCPNWTYIDLLDLSLSIANTLQKLHDVRIVVADFNPRNVLVKSPKQVYFIDIDSYQIDRQPSTVGIMMYTRPVHIKKSHKEYLKNRADDLYALSMMIFQNLTSGGNPYTTKQGGTEEELIKKHEFAFNVKEPHKSNANSALINAWSNLSIELRQFFEDVFRNQKPVLLSTLTQSLLAHKRSLMRVQTKTRSK